MTFYETHIETLESLQLARRLLESYKDKIERDKTPQLLVWTNVNERLKKVDKRIKKAENLLQVA